MILRPLVLSVRLEHSARVGASLRFGVARRQHRVFVVLKVARVPNCDLALAARFLQESRGPCR